MVNIFELFEIPMSFHPDPAKVKTKFYALSRQFHPDRFSQSGPEALAEAMNKTAAINKAYKILTNHQQLVQYMLRFNNVIVDDEKFDLSPDFLMDIMELNELLAEAEFEPSNSSLFEEAKASFSSHFEIIEEEMEALTNQYDSGFREKSHLQKIKEIYFKLKYLLRIQERITKFAAP